MSNQQKFGQDYEYQNKLNRKNADRVKNRKITSQRFDLQLPDNSIQTSKYTFYNFLPKNLIEQFSKIANLYFLIAGFCQIIPQISISDGVPTIFLPLTVILAITASKDFYEDYKRKKSDNEENKVKKYKTQQNQKKEACPSMEARNSTVYLTRMVTYKSWYILDKEFIPADVLILSTSEKKGMGYIETKSLDGETNLKQKNAQKDIYQYYGPKLNTQTLNSKNCIFSYELPNPILYKFAGTCVLPNQENDFPIDNNNIILRGCKLRNTKWVLGLVCYTGHDTKIMKNSFKARAKKSHLEHTMGQQIIFIFIVQIGICMFAALYYMIFYRENKKDLGYLGIDLNSFESQDYYNFFVRFGNWVLIFNNFVPISLLVTLEMVKFIQAIIIQKDQYMIYKFKDENDDEIITQTNVQSSNLNEELGQIEYVFSDKTGTLTCNIMEFKKISINGISYEQPNNEYDAQKFPSVKNVDFKDNKFFQNFSDKNNPEYQNILKTLKILALTHTVIIEIKNENGEKEQIYNASSPDELALVNFAKYCGVEFKGIDEEQNILYQIKGINKQVKLLHVFQFDSTRKRQSVLIQDLESNKIFLFCKGADSVLLALIDKQKSQKIEETEKNLDDYGNIGLRTLILCEREIPIQEYTQWQKQYQEACTTLVNREEYMIQVQALLEKDLILVGATAIEDKLQDKVGETIHSLKCAGIKVWVLTGDKVETAINIGFSCKLLSNDLQQYVIKLQKNFEMYNDQQNAQDIEDKLKKTLIEIQQNKDENGQLNYNNAFIITGESLIYVLKGELKNLLIQITNYCTAVLCCRVSPQQKQQIVTLVRENKSNVSTLAIGDGANDVNMICAAHVGIGINGVEGQQAARASDYSIGEFKILRNLLFYHGRESYRRNSRLVCFNFYKNIILVLPQFWFAIENAFSGQTLYDSYIYQLFNVVYASLPIIIYAVFDEQYEYKVLVANKKNYYLQGIKRIFQLLIMYLIFLNLDSLFNRTVFWSWFLNAVWQSVIICFFSFYSLEYTFGNQKGYSLNFWSSGTMVFSLAVLNANIKVIIISSDHSFASLFFNFGSIVVYIGTVLIIDIMFKTSNIYRIILQQKQQFIYIIYVIQKLFFIKNTINSLFPFRKHFSYWCNLVY
ncbi:phospholipid-translocating p-type flippase family protein, putative [Ichthyophthirius multifiliis]|uniref:Phospholipid-transporting ATPase n=1 Tax=Ichthyophthirius multifiliis TaxID=5932 RepID=G0QVP1_ICHMU|nr:phospholipid-translocating p-type flippase family protein, putative [Ichthyophthirius multifiliis]EGR30728.1 phospholipid-translocating p-type flippase family protein, putative [Ichthyophthirius multifiliis]|eukprot:XP_004032315.1 phospholipid-translocating p-type flippase family protein, putative [Ichthyophthirius multifiliis]